MLEKLCKLQLHFWIGDHVLQHSEFASLQKQLLSFPLELKIWFKIWFNKTKYFRLRRYDEVWLLSCFLSALWVLLVILKSSWYVLSESELKWWRMSTLSQTDGQTDRQTDRVTPCAPSGSQTMMKLLNIIQYHLLYPLLIKPVIHESIFFVSLLPWWSTVIDFPWWLILLRPVWPTEFPFKSLLSSSSSLKYSSASNLV